MRHDTPTPLSVSSSARADAAARSFAYWLERACRRFGFAHVGGQLEELPAGVLRWTIRVRDGETEHELRGNAVPRISLADDIWQAIGELHARLSQPDPEELAMVTYRWGAP